MINISCFRLTFKHDIISFNFYDLLISSQVSSETLSPIHVELTEVVAGKEGIICESVCAEFQELVSMCGGPNEKLRANHLLNRLRYVPS